jgi:hypothetical protein
MHMIERTTHEAQSKRRRGARLRAARVSICASLLLAFAGCAARRNLGSDGRSNPVLAGSPSQVSAGVGVTDMPALAGSDAGASATTTNALQPTATGAPPMPWRLDQTGADNPAGLEDADVKKLIAGGPLGTLRWLYPYDGTVFPGGTIAPTLMWDGDPATEAIYLHIKSIAFEYRTIVKPMTAQGSAFGSVGSQNSTPPQPKFQLPQDVWKHACELTQGKADPFHVELSTSVHGVVAGPVALQFTIAPGARHQHDAALAADEPAGVGPLHRRCRDGDRDDAG